MSFGEKTLSGRSQVPTSFATDLSVLVRDAVSLDKYHGVRRIVVAAFLGSHRARRKDRLTCSEGVSHPATQHRVPEDSDPQTLSCWDLIYISEAVSCSLTNQFLGLFKNDLFCCRSCWQCKRKFIKEAGCNKMTCTCGARMCYICRQPVTNYSHFNGQGGTEFHK